jgi:hypothetical protein
MKLGAVGDSAELNYCHRRGRAAKLSAHGEDAKFCPAASLQIKRHRRGRLKKLGAVGECAE